MHYYKSSQSHLAEQEALRAEYEKESRCEWTEQMPGQPEATLHSKWSRDYGVARLECAQCGTVFYCRSESYHTGRKYCCYRCGNDANTGRRELRRQEKRAKSCPICGKAFLAKRSDTRFCSSACKQKHYRMNRDADEKHEILGSSDQ